MRKNTIYWETANKQYAIDIIKVLRYKYLVIELRTRKNNKDKLIRQFDSGQQYPESVGIKKQVEFIQSCEINMYDYFVIKSV